MAWRSFLLVVLFLLLVGEVFLLFRLHETVTVPIFLSVGSYGGFHLDGEGVNLGTTVPGGGARRDVFVSGRNGWVIVANVEGADFFTVYPPVQVIQRDEGEPVTVLASVPENQTFGNYTGTLVLRVLPPVFQKFI